MSIIYPCNICDKQFNLNIKLKKHLKNSHTSTEQENQVNDAPNITEEANDEVSEKPYDVKNSNKVEEEKNESSFSFDHRHTPIDHDDTIPNDWKVLTLMFSTIEGAKFSCLQMEHIFCAED